FNVWKRSWIFLKKYPPIMAHFLTGILIILPKQGLLEIRTMVATWWKLPSLCRDFLSTGNIFPQKLILYSALLHFGRPLNGVGIHRKKMYSTGIGLPILDFRKILRSRDGMNLSLYISWRHLHLHIQLIRKYIIRDGLQVVIW